jgi:putative nucleotidyltransferase with HDIG domain
MTPPDRRHAVGVSHRAAEALGDHDGAAVPTNVLAAALLHDIGKIESGLGAFGRVAATLLATVAGSGRAARWSAYRPGFRRRVGLYLRHDGIGASMLEAVGSDPLVVGWAAEHHMPPERWSIDSRFAALLKAADDI